MSGETAMACDASSISRRNILAGAGLWAVLSAALTSKAIAGNARDNVASWANRLKQECADLRSGTVSTAQWRAALDALAADVALEDLLSAIDFERLRSATPFAEQGVSTSPVALPGLAGGRLAFSTKMFAIGPGRAIIPHGHENMVSAHLLLGGEMRLRQFDKLAREDDMLLVAPSVDKTIGAGEISSISLAEDNIHWMTTVGGAWTLDIIMTNIDAAAEKPYDIYNLDIEAAQVRPDGALLAPILTVPDALRKYD